MARVKKIMPNNIKHVVMISRIKGSKIIQKSICGTMTTDERGDATFRDYEEHQTITFIKYDIKD
jgi:hypothetical protein